MHDTNCAARSSRGAAAQLGLCCSGAHLMGPPLRSLWTPFALRGVVDRTRCANTFMFGVMADGAIEPEQVCMEGRPSASCNLPDAQAQHAQVRVRSEGLGSGLHTQQRVYTTGGYTLPAMRSANTKVVMARGNPLPGSLPPSPKPPWPAPPDSGGDPPGGAAWVQTAPAGAR